MVTASPQPAAGQRLQGLPRRRRRRSCRRPTPRSPRRSTPSGRWPTVPLRRRAGRPSATTCSTPTSTGVAGLVAADTPARPQRRLHAAARRRGATSCSQAFARAGFAAAVRRVRAGRAGPGLPDGRVPEPGGARRDRPGARGWRRPSDADLVLANDPDADRCAVAVPDAERPRAGGCCAATRSARCSAQHLIRRDPDLRRHVRRRRSSRRRCCGKIAAAHGLRLRRDAHRLQVDLPGARAARTATRRRSATASTRTRCATRTASRRALLVAELAATLKAEGRALLDLLDDLAPRVRPARDRPARRSGSTTSPRSTPRWRGCARQPPTALGGRRGDRGRRPGRGGRRPAARPTGCATAWPTAARVIVRPSRHRAQAQVLPRGRRAGGRTATSPPPGVRPVQRLAAIKRDIAAAAGLCRAASPSCAGDLVAEAGVADHVVPATGAELRAADHASRVKPARSSDLCSAMLLDVGRAPRPG